MTREEILEAAKKIVCTDREAAYGKPEDNFGLIAEFWGAYMRAAAGSIEDWDMLSAEDVAAMMILLKLARIATGKGKGKADNWIDIAGYAACGAECEAAGEA